MRPADRPFGPEKRGYVGAGAVCPHCQGDADFVGQRPHDVFSLNGTLRHRRAYYHCHACGRGHCPDDADLGLDGHWGPSLAPVVTLLGSLAPFATASDLLRRVNGLRYGTSTCRRLTEAVGAELQAQHAQGRAVPVPVPPAWDFSLPDRDGRKFGGTVAYAGLDAFAVPTRAAGGIDWKMLYVGLLYDPPKKQTLYLADYDFERLAGLLRAYAVRLGVGKAETLVALTDGGNGLERVLRQAVSGAVVCVLDWWHLSEKLHELGRLLHEPDAGAARAWAKARETTLWEQGGQALVGELDRLGCPEGASAEAQEKWRTLRAHVWKNRHRTDYPSYRSKGWDVGSGPTEAGCKILGQRVKAGGMRWLQGCSSEVATLKALYASGMGLWDAFWTQRQPGRGSFSARRN